MCGRWWHGMGAHKGQPPLVHLPHAPIIHEPKRYRHIVGTGVLWMRGGDPCGRPSSVTVKRGFLFFNSIAPCGRPSSSHINRVCQVCEKFVYKELRRFTYRLRLHKRTLANMLDMLAMLDMRHFLQVDECDDQTANGAQAATDGEGHGRTQ